MNTDDNNQIILGADGDPLPDPRGSRMIETESYERVVDGLKMAAEGAAHVAVHEYHVSNMRDCNMYSGMARRLDQVRMIAVELGGVDLSMKQRETAQVRTRPMPFSQAKKRLREGLKQAGGGMRQIAACHRGDLRWSDLATMVESLLDKVTANHARTLGRQPSALIMPSTASH